MAGYVQLHIVLSLDESRVGNRPEPDVYRDLSDLVRWWRVKEGWTTTSDALIQSLEYLWARYTVTSGDHDDVTASSQKPRYSRLSTQLGSDKAVQVAGGSNAIMSSVKKRSPGWQEGLNFTCCPLRILYRKAELEWASG